MEILNIPVFIKNLNEKELKHNKLYGKYLLLVHKTIKLLLKNILLQVEIYNYYQIKIKGKSTMIN